MTSHLQQFSITSGVGKSIENNKKPFFGSETVTTNHSFYMTNLATCILEQQVPKMNTYFLPHCKPNLLVKPPILLFRTGVD